jgi:hypothetical protein
VEIAVAVAEAGEARPRLVLHQLFEMAAEAQLVPLELEWGVQISRVGFGQQAEVLAGVGRVTGGAVALADRPMQVRVLLEPHGQVLQRAAVGGLDRLVVAGEAELLLGHPQQARQGRVVRAVARGATARRDDGPVDDRRAVQIPLDVIVAREAELRGFTAQLVAEIRRVRVMTFRAALLERLVPVARAGAGGRHRGVATEAQLVRRSGQELLVGALVRVVAGQAALGRDRPVDELPVPQPQVVALVTKTAGRCLHEHDALIGPVRVMAGRAVALFDRGVDDVLVAQVVALPAELIGRCDEGEPVLDRSFVLVADEALPLGGRAVHHRSVHDVRVAGVVGAVGRLRCGLLLDGPVGRRESESGGAGRDQAPRRPRRPPAFVGHV